jgi:hypothetical protein
VKFLRIIIYFNYNYNLFFPESNKEVGSSYFFWGVGFLDDGGNYLGKNLEVFDFPMQFRLEIVI